MKSDKYLGFLWKTCISNWGIFLNILGVIFASLALFAIDGGHKITLRYALLFFVLLFYFTLLFIRLSWTIHKSGFPKLPPVKHATTDNISNLPLLLLEPSELYNFGSMVAVYFLEDQFERLIGFGRVSNVQDNGMIQVLILKKTENEREVWPQIVNNQADKIKYIIVKPHFPFDLMEFMR